MKTIQETLKSAALAIALMIAPGVANAQGPDLSNAKIATIDVAENIYMLAGMGGNIALSVSDDGAFLVDNQFAQVTDKIMAAVKDKTDGPVTFLFNTHWHGDHTGGNENFGNMGIPIIAQENVRARMSVDTKSYMSGNTIKAAPAAALPAITFTESTSLYQGGQRIDLIKVPPAHTDGDAIVVYRNSNVIHMGDVFLNNIYPFIDYGSGGTLEGMIKAVNLGIDLADDDTKVIPGHGELATKADMVRYRDMLLVVKEKVAEGQASGKSLEELLEEKPLAELETAWGGTPFRNGSQVYESVFKDEQLN